MKTLTQKQCVRRLRNEQLNIFLYEDFKASCQKLGARVQIQSIKSKKQKEIVKQTWSQMNHVESEKTLNLFLANLYVYDDADFANRVEEALSMCVRPEDIVGYLRIQGYPIPDTIYKLKLAEFEVYQEYYKQTNIWYMVKDILEKTGVKEASIAELKDYKEKQLQMQTKEAEKQKVIVFPSSYIEEKVA